MRWNVVLIDPPGYRFGHFLHDTARYLVHGLQSLGHDCILSRSNVDGGRMNVLLNAHMLATPADVEQLGRVPYIVYQTEVIRQGQTNLDPDERHRKVYLPLLRGARRVWDWSADNVALLQEQGIGADWLRLGHHPALEEIHHKREKDIDFLFYGSVTPHRAAILTALAESGRRVRAEFDVMPLYRNDLIARSRVVLTLRQSEEMDHLPYFRINYLVNNRSLVAGETGVDGAWMEDVFLGCPPGRTVEHLLETAARKDLAEVAQAHHAQLLTRPMTGFLAVVLAKDLNI